MASLVSGGRLVSIALLMLLLVPDTGTGLEVLSYRRVARKRDDQ